MSDYSTVDCVYVGKRALTPDLTLYNHESISESQQGELKCLETLIEKQVNIIFGKKKLENKKTPRLVLNLDSRFPMCIKKIIRSYFNYTNKFNKYTFLVTPKISKMPSDLLDSFNKLFKTQSDKADANSYLKGSMKLMANGGDSLHTFDKRYRYLLHEMVHYVDMTISKYPKEVVYEFKTDMKQFNMSKNRRNESYGYHHRNTITSYVYRLDNL
jgi:hypothetical protein